MRPVHLLATAQPASMDCNGHDGNDAGDAGFTFATAAPIPKGHTVTATATSAGGDTSEFSPAQPVS